jgi:hypothetical protein
MAQGSSGFDLSRMSTATKILLGGGVLLFIDSFLSWQKVCFEIAGLGGCVTANMWGGDGSFFGLLGGLLTIALLIWEGLALANVDLNVGMPRSKISAYVGFGVLGFVVIKFIFAMTQSPAFGAFIGLILALAVGYGAWMRFQEPEARPMAPPTSSDTPGFTG